VSSDHTATDRARRGKATRVAASHRHPSQHLLLQQPLLQQMLGQPHHH
jgi:hypothetical protein